MLLLIMLHCQNLLKDFLVTNYGITLPNTRKEINFIKHVLPKVFDYLDYKTTDLKQPRFQDEYFRTRNCSLLLLSPKILVKFMIKKTLNLKQN